jgi:hypothetical protein
MSFADPWKPTACTSEVIMMTSGIAIMPLVGQMSVALSIFQFCTTTDSGSLGHTVPGTHDNPVNMLLLGHTYI